MLKRGAPASSIRWLEAPVCYVFHYLNAWNEGSKVTFDSVDFPVAPNFPNADGSIPAHADAQGKLTRWTLDVDTGAIDRQQTLDVASEFPRIDDRFAALAIVMATLQPLHKGQRVTVAYSTRLPISIAIRVMSALGTRVLETVFLNLSLLRKTLAQKKARAGCWRLFMTARPARLPW